ncbi:MAG: hypothetical protein FJZ66_06015 [Bacteroidetes bacterium]|nr:hypothetical protein [Bacteroidota bacterium]
MKMALYLVKVANKNIIMNKIIPLIIVTLLSTFSFAQTEKTASERAKNQTKKMTEELKLSNEQQSRIYEINLGINQKIDGLKSSGLSEEEKKKALNHNNQARKEMIKGVLTAEQNEVLEKKLASRKVKRQQMRKEVRKEIKEEKKKKSE